MRRAIRLATSAPCQRRTGCKQQSSFAAVLSTQEWIQGLALGIAPQRATIYQSNQRARGLLEESPAASYAYLK